MEYQQTSPMETLDGQQLKQLVRAALSWLRQHQEVINALNVFPVPDGDTGTNMMLTMTSAWNEIEHSPEKNAGQVMSGVAHGALMGARGNSGVILSQIWRGFARSMDTKPELRVADFAAALRVASETAYKGVVKPVEGTILTVVRETAEAAQDIAAETDDLVLFFERIVQEAKLSEARTPSLLPVLRQAGVVDSGGQGLVVIFEGMWRSMVGLPVDESKDLAQVVDLTVAEPHAHGELEFDSNYPYDVQFIVVGEDMDIDALRASIEEIGDCALTVGDSRTIKVHVHVPDPGVPLSYAVKYGSLRDVVVEDMQAQYQEFISGREGYPVIGPGAPQVPTVFPEIDPSAVGILAVAAGKGIERVFRSLGAAVVIEGGQTMNPSTAQILEGLERIPSEEVIILPNNKNILLAAQQAAEVCEKQVHVVPTHTIPQGVAALLFFDSQASLESNAEAMAAAAEQIITGEVTWATRDVVLNGVTVEEGNAIGLLNGDLVVATDSFDEVVRQLLDDIDIDIYELVTLYYGEGVDVAQAERLVAALTEEYETLEFELVEGGQPHYPYLLSIE